MQMVDMRVICIHYLVHNYRPDINNDPIEEMHL